MCASLTRKVSVSESALREAVGDVPDDGAIAEIVAALERGDS